MRHWREDRDQASVLAVAGKETVGINQVQRSVTAMVTDRPSGGGERIRAAAGSTGLRWYDWQRLERSDPAPAGWQRWLVFRRSISDPRAVPAYRAFAAASTPLTALVRVAGTRWTVEESIQTAKGDVGRDHYAVRSWTGWYRHLTVVLWAHAFLAVIRDETGAAAPKKGVQNQPVPHRLARFKAHRGLRSAAAVPRFATCFGR